MMICFWSCNMSIKRVNSIFSLLFPDSHLMYIVVGGKSLTVQINSCLSMIWRQQQREVSMGATGSPADMPIEICDEVEETTEVKKSLVGRQTRQNTRIQEKDLLWEFPPGVKLLREAKQLNRLIVKGGGALGKLLREFVSKVEEFSLTCTCFDRKGSIQLYDKLFAASFSRYYYVCRKS